jgi:hypothetical protein
MTNDDSYKMMQALRRYLHLKVYNNGKGVEVVLSFKTEDGKLHQLCNSYKENVNDTNNA